MSSSAGSIALPEGFRVGHWTDLEGITGCTVILCPGQTVAGCDVRGNSPGSRELALLGATKKVQEIHALLLTGGSAYGLAAADGVMRYLEEQEIGYETPWARVPIVPAAVVFDLNIGRSDARPTSDSGYHACRCASNAEVDQGSVGAGTGATVGKWAGTESRMKGGVGTSTKIVGELVSTAVVVVNAVGDILDEKGGVLAGARGPDGTWEVEEDPYRAFASRSVLHTNTTLAAVITNARLTKVEAIQVAERAHDGIARTIKPCHTNFDGDVAFTLASGRIQSTPDLVAEVGADAVTEAIRSAVHKATGLGGVPSCLGK